jgi:hypothetical protein
MNMNAAKAIARVRSIMGRDAASASILLTASIALAGCLSAPGIGQSTPEDLGVQAPKVATLTKKLVIEVFDDTQYQDEYLMIRASGLRAPFLEAVRKRWPAPGVDTRAAANLDQSEALSQLGIMRSAQMSRELKRTLTAMIPNAEVRLVKESLAESTFRYRTAPRRTNFASAAPDYVVVVSHYQGGYAADDGDWTCTSMGALVAADFTIVRGSDGRSLYSSALGGKAAAGYLDRITASLSATPAEDRIVECQKELEEDAFWHPSWINQRAAWNRFIFTPFVGRDWTIYRYTFDAANKESARRAVAIELARNLPAQAHSVPGVKFTHIKLSEEQLKAYTFEFSPLEPVYRSIGAVIAEDANAHDLAALTQSSRERWAAYYEPDTIVRQRFARQEFDGNAIESRKVRRLQMLLEAERSLLAALEEFTVIPLCGPESYKLTQTALLAQDEVRRKVRQQLAIAYVGLFATAGLSAHAGLNQSGAGLQQAQSLLNSTKQFVENASEGWANASAGLNRELSTVMRPIRLVMEDGSTEEIPAGDITTVRKRFLEVYQR